MAAFSIPPLPFGYDALTGKGFSKEQLSFHYDKHHTGYVTKLNAAAKENEAIGKKTIEELILHEKGPLFNLAAQIWNHTFYWNCLASNGGGTPGGKIGSAIDDNFGSFPKFKEEFTNAAVDLERRMPRIQARMEERLGRKLDPEALRPMLGVHTDYLRAALDAIGTQHSSADAYITDVLGIDAAARQLLRERLTA